MCLFKKKSGGKKEYEKDNAQVIKNMRLCESFTGYDIPNDIKDELITLCDKLKYVTPSTKTSVISMDKKIENTLSDLKIELSKKDIKTDNVKAIIKNIINMVANREFEEKSK